MVQLALKELILYSAGHSMSQLKVPIKARICNLDLRCELYLPAYTLKVQCTKMVNDLVNFHSDCKLDIFLTMDYFLK